jgi:Flp pilus assembly protein TadB
MINKRILPVTIILIVILVIVGVMGMNYVFLIIAGILGVIVGRYLGRRRGIKKEKQKIN